MQTATWKRWCLGVSMIPIISQMIINEVAARVNKRKSISICGNKQTNKPTNNKVQQKKKLRKLQFNFDLQI